MAVSNSSSLRNVPRTKQSEAAKPYEGPLPSYMALLESEARAAGLAVTHLRRADGSVATSFAGSRQQILGFRRVVDAERLTWPRCEVRPSGISLESRSPWHGRSGLFRIDDDRFAIQLIEYLPNRWKTVAPRVECFVYLEGTEGEAHAFVGAKEDLVRANLVDVELFPDESTEDGRLSNGCTRYANAPAGNAIRSEETERLPDDLWAYFRYPGAQALADQRWEAVDQAVKPDFNNAEDYRSSLLGIAEIMVSALGNGRTARDGRSYRLTAQSAAAVRLRVEQLLQEIRNANVAIDGGKPSLRLVGGRDA